MSPFCKSCGIDMYWTVDANRIVWRHVSLPTDHKAKPDHWDELGAAGSRLWSELMRPVAWVADRVQRALERR